MPGLDGVRALAVLAVMAFHEGIRGMPGGFLGVDVFFVLSGYLITDLLVAHRSRRGRMDLRGFWTRRARRLLPALAVVLVAVTAAVAVAEPGQLAALRPALAAAVTYSSNWYEATRHVSYFAQFGPPPPLQHLWSLAIEEQFYLAWPLILGLVLMITENRRARAGVAWAGAAASALLMALLYTPGGDPSRVYYGTDTHASALLIGSALALTWPLAKIAAATRELTLRLDFIGMAGLAVLAWAAGHFSGADPVVYPAGLIVAALAAGGLILAAAAPGAISALLSLPPLRWLGVRSYGIYLWHWPVIAIAVAIIGPGRPSPAWLWIIEAAIAIGLAAASWKWIEAPILRAGFRGTFRTWRRGLADSAAAAWRSPARGLPVLVAVAALSVACTAGYGVLHATDTSAGLMQQIAQGERVSAATRAHAARGNAFAPAGPAPGQASSPQGAAPAGGSAARKVPGRQVTAIGDSVMLASAAALRTALPGIYIDAQVSRQMTAGLTEVQNLAAQGLLRRVVVVGLGTNGMISSGQVRELLAELGPSRDLVLVNTYEARPWEHEVNTVLSAAARRYPHVVLANWRAAIAHRTYLLWGDGVHPRPSGARLYAKVVAAAVQVTQAAKPPAQQASRNLASNGPPGIVGW